MIQLIKTFVLVLTIAWIAIPSESIAQSALANLDLKTINVDEMSDDEIRNYIKRAEARGLTENEVTELARSRGMSESQILKLKTRINGIRQGTNQGPQSGLISTNSLRATTETPFGLTQNVVSEDLSPEEANIFGIGLFRRANVSFVPGLNLPTPVDYQLGPNDEIIVDLWGDTQQSLRFVVSREGAIKPDKLGPIYINGLTIKRAEEKIIERLSQIYSGLKGGPEERKIFYQVSLGQIRTISVEIIGLVEQPGIYSLPSLATVYHALHASGGPSVDGTFRDIRLIRNGKLLASIDIYTFLTSGIKSGDLRLKDGDIIMVPSYKNRVTIEGEIKAPAAYELKSNEPLEKLLEYANGFTNQAYKSVIGIKRNGDSQRELLDISAEDYGNFLLKDGDVIEIGKILARFSNRVVIDGAVLREGEYELQEDMTVKSLVEKADGLRGDAVLDRAAIYRKNSDYTESVIAFDLKGIMDGTVADIKLQKEDLLVINSIYDLNEEYFVQISGEVSEQGVYPFFKQMTVQDLIVLAGGFKESASKSQIEISRRNTSDDISINSEIISIPVDEELRLSVEDRNILIQPFDRVFIRKSVGYSVQETVTVEGEVTVQGDYAIGRKGERVSDIVARAKGLTPYAYAEGAVLIRRTEFNLQTNGDIIGQETLENLREKILLNESELKNSSRSALLNRLIKLRSTSESRTDVDIQGSDFKATLARQADSVSRGSIPGRELVALNLDKILDSPGGKYDLMVKSGDVISIPTRLQTVRITGEVTSPLSFRYDESFRFKDYIQRSGGFLKSARRLGSYVQYPNGERRGVRHFLFFKSYPEIQPGTTIFIGKKEQKTPINFQAIIAAAGSVATLALVFDRLAN